MMKTVVNLWQSDAIPRHEHASSPDMSDIHRTDIVCVCVFYDITENIRPITFLIFEEDIIKGKDKVFPVTGPVWPRGWVEV